MTQLHARIKLVMFVTVLAGAILFSDVSLPLGVAVGFPYVILVLVGLWFPDGRAILGYTELAMETVGRQAHS